MNDFVYIYISNLSTKYYKLIHQVLWSWYIPQHSSIFLFSSSLFTEEVWEIKMKHEREREKKKKKLFLAATRFSELPSQLLVEY